MSLVEFEGNLYEEINPLNYVKSNAEFAELARKFAKITAHQGLVGEEVLTKMKNGLTETKNVVGYDAENGEPDWIVTQVNGEKQVVTNKSFCDLYDKNSDFTSEQRPKGKIRPINYVDTNVCFLAPWGETQYIKKGGFLITLAKNNIYGIQQQEFNDMYEKVEGLGENLLNVNLTDVENVEKPKIFLSVAYPHYNISQQQFLKQVIEYINSKGVSAVNIKKITDENINLLKEITNCLSTCQGIVSLAFCREGNRTSPFIHIENSLAFACNLPSFTIVPGEIEQEGVIHIDNNDRPTVTFGNCDLNSVSNQILKQELDKFINYVVKVYKNKLTNNDLASFKSLLITEEKKVAEQKIVSFLKKRYSLKKIDLKLNQIYIKRPVEIVAVEIHTSGYYSTKNGNEYLQKGDFIVTDIDDKVYSVTKQNFEETYVKVSGTKDKYVKKLIPVVVTKTSGNLTIYPLHNPKDVYSPDIKSFKENYMTLTEFVKSANTVQNNYENNFS